MDTGTSNLGYLLAMGAQKYGVITPVVLFCRDAACKIH